MRKALLWTFSISSERNCGELVCPIKQAYSRTDITYKVDIRSTSAKETPLRLKTLKIYRRLDAFLTMFSTSPSISVYYSILNPDNGNFNDKIKRYSIDTQSQYIRLI